MATQTTHRKLANGGRAVRIPAGEIERIIAEGTIPARERR
jgi:hypothetical protein